jgi:hypothetical protein
MVSGCGEDTGAGSVAHSDVLSVNEIGGSEPRIGGGGTAGGVTPVTSWMALRISKNFGLGWPAYPMGAS